MQPNKNFSECDFNFRARDRNGDVLEEYHLNGLDGPLHRPDGPAVKVTLNSGIVMQEEYYQNGKLHRVDGPALIHRRSTDGSVSVLAYYKDGQLHREDGPARILKDSDGRIASEMYCLDGKPIKGEQSSGTSRGR